MSAEPTLVNKIQEVTPRDTVEVHLDDGRVLSGPRGTAIEAFFQALPEWNDVPIVGAVINSELRELTYPITMDARARPIDTANADGARIYRRSLTFLLEAAFDDLFREPVLVIDHSVSSGGYYCHVLDRDPLTQAEIDLLEKHMRELVKADLPFQRRRVPLRVATELFEEKGEADKVRLMKYRRKDHLVLYQLGDHNNYHHGYMVPSSGYLKWFDLVPMGEGFILRYPRRHSPTKLLPIPESPKLLATFQQYGNWLSRLGIVSVGALNDATRAGRIDEIVLVSEALHEQKIAEIATQIASLANQARIVLIAGPSSSGKTTFSKRLSVQLLAHGVSPMPIELDNYFIDRDKTPRDELGNLDYETLKALNTQLLTEQMQRLIRGEEVQLPRYNFITGKSEQGDTVRLEKDQLIILEGIHGLNPNLIPEIPAEYTFRLYVSALTQLNLDTHNRISTTDTRLIRRIVRDARERGYSARQTIERWELVRRGEKRYIFPFQDNANEMFNSALVYEMSALMSVAEPLLRQVPFGTPEYIEAKRLLAFLEWFLPVDPEFIPDNSILREFIGGSSLKEFHIWGSTGRAPIE
jgi:uridine kinase